MQRASPRVPGPRTRRRKRWGWEGYEPDPSRLTVWGINGVLHEELAERGTLGTRRVARKALPGNPYGGPI